MILNKLVLDNIKSYKHEVINFNSGINCVLGLNGSGKTTIIESIGLALFNFKKASSFNSMLRYNETKGSIEIHFTANDSRDYKIIRQIKKNSSNVKIIDCENDTELYNTVEDVYSFVQKILGINKAREFSKLFEQVIAVSQGEYVNAFLETPAKRKENFDRLFGLHIYKNIADKLKLINDNIKSERITKINEELKLIEGKTINYKRDKTLLNDIKIEIEELKENINKLTLEKEDSFNKKKELEELKINIDKLEQDNIIKETNLNNYLTEKARLNKDLLLAKEAARLVSENLTNYLRYQENLNLINQLEKQISDNEVNSKKHNDVSLKLQLKEKDIENKQLDLNKKKDLLNEKNVEYEQNSKDLYILKTEYENIKEKYHIDEKKYKEELEVNVLEIKEKEELLYQLRLIFDKIDETNYITDDLIKKYEDNLTSVNSKLSSYIEIEEQINDLINKSNIIKNERENNFNNAKLTEGGICPFLNEKCKNINGENLSSYFTRLMEENDKDLIDIDKNIINLKEKLVNKKSEIEQKNNIEAKISMVNMDIKRRTKVLNDFCDVYKDLIDPMISSVDNLHQLISKYNDEVDRLNIEKAKLQDTNLSLISRNTDLNTFDFRLKQLESKTLDIENTVKDIKKDINLLEFEDKQLKKSKNELATVLEDLKIKLKDNDKFINDLKRVKEENSGLQESRDIYTVNIDKSKEVTKITSLITNNQQTIDELEKIIRANNDKLLLYKEKFSPKLLESFTIKYEHFKDELTKNNTTLKEKLKTYNNLEIEVKLMDELLNEKEKLVIKLNQLKDTIDFLIYMRELYGRLPQELSNRYREYVSYMATNSYRKISKEPVHISISEDYELKLIDDNNDKNIKTIDQLSGGEQMSIALAVRFSMMKQLSGLDIYFLDEPTINLDYQRRNNISEVVSDISKDLSQLFVISHDDTFDDITERIIKVIKEDNISRVK